MRAAATRWRLLELQRQRRAIEAGVDLLDRKREGLLRALLQRRAAAHDTRRRLAGPLDRARLTLDRALVLVGEAGGRAAAIAQPRYDGVRTYEDSIVGVRVLRLEAANAPFALHYGPDGTCAELDEAARLFTALLPDITQLAQEERAEATLRRGLRRTTRTLNALKAVLLPSVDADIRAVASALEEDEREEALRWRHRPLR